VPRCGRYDTERVNPPVLAALDEPTRRQLLGTARRRRFRRNEVVFHAGDVPNGMYVLLGGYVGVRVNTPTGESAILTVLGPGAVFGELTLLWETDRSATVAALEPAEALVLSKDQFERLRQTHAPFDRFLIDLLSGYVRRLEARLLEALYVPVDKRVLRRVISLSHLYGDGSAGTVIPLTQETLAGMVGSTRPTINQVLRSADASGLISVSRGQVRVDDPARLARQAR
jgi:CRP/FNR family transcriptional regulator, cyclic AMP receptor protein